MMDTIVVTGARGRLGAALVRFLQNNGEDVVGISRADIELSNIKQVMSSIGDIRPSLIFNAAAFSDVDGCEKDVRRAYQDNARAAANLVRAADFLGARLIHFSTDYVFDGEKSAAYGETDAPNPVSVYGKTKLEGERSVAEVSTNYCIIRISWLFGVPGDFVSFVIDTVKKGNPLRLATDHRGSPSYVPDILPGVLDIAASHEQGIFHLANGGGCSRLEMGSEIVRILGLDAEIIPSTGEDIGFLARRPRQSVLSCGRYEKVFNRILRSWQEAMHDYCENPG